jgi:HlyD family secretion protein
LAAQNAEARFLEIEAGPPADRVTAAREAVRSARATLTGATDRLNEVNSRPTRAELRDAEERVGAARIALERVQSEPEPVLEESDPGAFDLIVLQKNLEQDRAQVETLERELAATTLTAPYSGVVSAVQARPGDPLDRGVPVLSLARPGDPIVSADVSGEDASRIAVGQQATVILEGSNGIPHDAKITNIVDGPGGVGRTAQLQVTWPTLLPAFAHVAQVVVTTQEKSDVLLVPQRAVRSSGQRRYVEYMDGSTRRTADVSLGIMGAVDVEVLSGLREGQLVVVGTGSVTTGGASTAPTATATR